MELQIEIAIPKLSSLKTQTLTMAEYRIAECCEFDSRFVTVPQVRYSGQQTNDKLALNAESSSTH